VFGLAFKLLLLLKKQKVKPNSSAFFQVLLEKLLFRSSILKAPWGCFCQLWDFSTLKFGDFLNLTSKLLKIQ
jgi:hypothetical protein